MATAFLQPVLPYGLITSAVANPEDANATRPDWLRVREILARALSLPPAERSRLLEADCGRDHRLRREVESLLAAANGPAFLDEPATVPVADRASLRAPSGTGPEGRVVSHYEIGSKIGEGGMGAVYRAVDLNLGRTVALKVVSGANISDEEKRRFAREAKAASALNHPNIVTIYEYNSADGIDFLAMEYVEGATLAQVLAQGKASLSQLLGYAAQIASALGKAHAAGIVHRDLKPGNIMINAEGVAKVLDFGLAKITAPEMDGVTALTRPNAILGTPGYMSPEQALGEATDHRSDIFSFGSILYEMVSGERAFQGPDVASTLRQVIWREPPPVRRMGAAVPEPVTQLIERCLRKDREERLQSLSDAVAVLEGARGLPVSVQEPTVVAAPLVTAGKQRSQRGVGMLLAIGVAGGALLVPEIATKLRRTSPTASTPGTSEEWYALGQTYLARYERKGNTTRAVDAFQNAIQLDPQHAAAYARLAETYLVAAGARLSDPQWTKLALEASNRALELNPHLAAAHATSGFAMVNLSSDRAPEGMRRLERAIELDPRSALAHCYLGQAFEKTKQPGRAEESFRKAASLEPDNWVYQQRLGIFQFRVGRYAESVRALEAAARLTPDNAEVNANLGGVYQAVGRFEESAAAFQRSLEASPTARGFTNLGTLQYLLGRYTDAADAFERAIQLDGASYLRWGNLGDAYRWVPGKKQRSLDAYAQAIRLARENLDANPSKRMYARL